MNPSLADAQLVAVELSCCDVLKKACSFNSNTSVLSWLQYLCRENEWMFCNIEYRTNASFNKFEHAVDSGYDIF